MMDSFSKALSTLPESASGAAANSAKIANKLDRAFSAVAPHINTSLHNL
jgi:hypothetical protein